jgi:hypothetical protein
MQGPDTDAQDHPLHLFTSGLQRTAGPYKWVKRRNTRKEQMFSALPSNSDIARRSRHVAKVPKVDIPTTDPEGQIFLFSKCTKVGIASGLIGNYRSLGSEVA